jgi:hypothetical protein
VLAGKATLIDLLSACNSIRSKVSLPLPLNRTGLDMVRMGRASSSFFYFLAVLNWFLSGCTGATLLVLTPTPVSELTQIRSTIEATVTATSLPSHTPTSIQQASPTPTKTPHPTSSSTPASFIPTSMVLPDIQSVDEGGFSFQPLAGFYRRTNAGQVTLFNQNEDIVFSLTGVEVRSYGQLVQVFTRFLSQVGENFEEFTTENQFPITIDGSTGIAVNIHGKLDEEPVNGQVVAIAPSESQLFFAIALTTGNPDGPTWETAGKQLFEALLNSVKFFPIQKGSSPP